MKLDMGCGPNKKPDHLGCDKIAFDGVDHVFNIGKERWPFDDDSVDEVHSSHFLEHLEQAERCHFFSELWRVLKKGGKAVIITPHGASGRAYGDPTHRWPAMYEFSYHYLDKNWREANAKHTDKRWNPDEPCTYSGDCDFLFVVGNAPHPALAVRNQEFQQFAMQWYREAAQDIYGNLTKR